MDIIINTILGIGGGYALKYFKDTATGLGSNLIAGAVGGNIVSLIVHFLSQYLSDGGVNGFNVMSLILPFLGGVGGAFFLGFIKEKT